MATYPINNVKGRAIELVNRVKSGDPAASRLYAVPLSTSLAQATGQDTADLAAWIVAGAVEQTAGGWARITLAAADITALSPDNVNDRYDADFIDLAWGSPASGSTTGVAICYASVVTPTNGQLSVISHHDMVFTGDGSAITATVNVFYRAS